MKKFVLFLFTMFVTLTYVNAQCDAPANVQADVNWNRVNLTWESSLLDSTGFDDALNYNLTGELGGIGLDEAGTFSVVIRFPVDSLTSRNGMYLTHVGFAPASLTATTFTIKVWTGGSYTSGSFDEGTLVSTTVVPVSQVTAGVENIIRLNTPVLINATQELWVGYEIAGTGDHPAGARPAPHYDNFNDLLYMGGWSTLSDYDLDYGWDISTYYMNSLPEITGFNIFRDNVQLNTSLVTTHSYTDENIAGLTNYCYTIQSVCTSTTSSSSPLCITTPLQPTCYPMIGNGTSTTYLFPFNPYYRYSYSQQIFDASELGAQAGTIASMTFQYMYSSPITMNDITVYMANIPNSSFSNGNSWIPGSELTEVFHGIVHCSNADSNNVTIYFDNMFEWDGQSNVVVALLNNQGSYDNSDDRFYTHSTTSNKVLYWYTDNSSYNINAPGSGTLSSNRNNMKFCFGPEPSCYKPTHLSVSNITASSADLTWYRHSENDNNFEVVCVLADEPVGSGTIQTANDTTFTVTGLSDNTAYDVYVRTACSASDQSSWVKISFRTECVTHVGVPFLETFNGYGPGGSDTYAPCWSRETNNTTPYPFINSIGILVSYSYNNYYSLAISQPIDLSSYSSGTLALGFWIAQNDATQGRMDVGYMTDPTNINTFVTLKSYYPSDYHLTGYFQQEYITLDQAFTTPIYLAFYAPAPGTTTTNYVYIDNVAVDFLPECTSPNSLSVSDVIGTAALVSWDAAQYGATSYTLEYGVSGQAMTAVPVTGTSYQLTGLSQGTEYNVLVYSNCSGTNSDTLSTTFTTLSFLECQVPDTTGTAVVGASTVTTYSLPVNNFYNYSYTQQIYTADEIDSTHTPTVITAIGINYGYSSPNSAKTNVKVYLAHRSTSTFSSTSDWTPISEATLVYEGPLVCQQGWNTFNFDTYFSYNGSDNLVLIVDDNSGVYNSSSYVFNAHSTSSDYRTLYFQNDATNPDPVSPPTGTRTYNRNDIKFFKCNQIVPISCPLPYVSVSDVDEESITVSWIANGNETQWNLEYQATGDTTWTSVGTVTSSPYTISDLDQNANYLIRLQALCSETESSEWTYTTAHTPCEAVEIPFSENFDSETGSFVSCWSRLYNTSTITPIVTTTQHYSGTKSLYFNCSSTGNYAYAITPRFDDDVDMADLQIMFYAYKTSASFFIEVGIMSDPEDVSTFVSLGQFSPSTINTWELGEAVSDNYTGTGHYVAFRVPQWIPNNIFIDDIEINSIPSCMHVRNVYASSVQTDGATISWTAGGTESQWNYVYGPAGTVDPSVATPTLVSQNSATITGLNPNTLYDVYVQAYCSAEDQSTWMRSSFRTECAAMTALPYAENFDSYIGSTSTSTNILPSCWTSINGGTSYSGLPTTYQTTTSHSGNNSLYFYTYNSSSYADQYAVLPEIDTIAVPINTIMLSMYMRSLSTSYPFEIQVGVMSDPNDASTFVPVTTVQTIETTYQLKEAYLNNFTGSGNYIALKAAMPTSGYNYGYIDDIELSLIPSCSPVYNLEVSNIAGASALVSWNPGPFGTADTYTIEYSEAGQGNWITASNNLTATSFMLSNLQPTTSYDVRVKTTCSDASESSWETATFTTRCLAGGEIAIVNGTATSSSIPVQGCYRYTLSQQLFTSAEFNGNTLIRGIKFNVATTTSDSRNVTVYLGNTTQSSLSTSSYIPTTNQTQVYSGSMSTATTGWVELTFTTPFNYTGGNLVLTVHDNTGSYTCTPSFAAHAGNSISYWSDSSNPDPSSATPCTFNSIAYRNNIIFIADCDSTTTCIAPNIIVNNITTTSADVVWAAGYEESTWELDYTLYGDSVWTSVANPTGNLAQITGLTANTQYQVRMKSICDAGEESDYNYTDFRTACGTIETLPFVENFDDYGVGLNHYPTCWGKINTYAADRPYIVSSPLYAGIGSLAFYATSGTYNIAITPEFDASIAINSLQATFMYRANLSTDKLIVGVMTNPADATTFVPVETIYPATTPTSWEEKTVMFNNYSGTGAYIAFKNEFTNNLAVAFIDNLTIETIPTCPKPMDFAVIGSTSNSVTLSWTEMGSASNWEIEYGVAGFTPGQGTTENATTNPFIVDNLTMGTTYDFYIRAVCSTSDQSVWRGPITATPGTYIMATTGTATITMCGGTIYDDGGVNNEYSSNCYSTLTINPETAGLMVQLTGTYNTESGYDELSIYDGASTSGTLLGTYSGTGTITHTSTTGPLTLLFESDGSVVSSGFALEISCVNYTTTCDAPTNLQISNVTANSATATWTAGGNESSWNIHYKMSSASEWNDAYVTTPSYTLQGLNAQTTYDVQVQAKCSETEVSGWVSKSFTTQGTGISSVELANSISIMPNPAEKYIELTINSNINVTEAAIYNAYGQLIQKLTLNDNHARIDVSDMAAGMYFVRIANDNTMATKKFIKK